VIAALLLAAVVAAPAVPAAVSSPARAVAPGLIDVAPDLQVRPLRPGVWLHTSWKKLEDGTPFPSNGLLVKDGRELLLVDTAWGEGPTSELLRWIDLTLKLPVRRAVVTHFHDDRTGGLSLLAARGVRVYAHPLTLGLVPAADRARLTPLAGLSSAGGEVSTVGPLEVFYPGPAHSRDNVVVWVPSARVLFGTCATRAADATSLGNVADADVPEWPESIRRVLERYPRAAVVVPGHGDPGGVELLRHTLELLGSAPGATTK